jgi:hypothetical protein
MKKGYLMAFLASTIALFSGCGGGVNVGSQSAADVVVVHGPGGGGDPSVSAGPGSGGIVTGADPIIVGGGGGGGDLPLVAADSDSTALNPR